MDTAWPNRMQRKASFPLAPFSVTSLSVTRPNTLPTIPQIPRPPPHTGAACTGWGAALHPALPQRSHGGTIFSPTLYMLLFCSVF